MNYLATTEFTLPRGITAACRALLGIVITCACITGLAIHDGKAQESVAGLQRLLSEGGRLSPVKNPFGRREHVVCRINGDAAPTRLSAEIDWISKPWNNDNAQMPYLVYMPEKDRLLMLVECLQPIQSCLITSDDHGKTWSERRWLSVDQAGKPNGVGLGLTYLGQGKLLAFPEENSTQWFSADYGQTWERRNATAPSSGERNSWDPLFVVRNAHGDIERLLQAWWRPTGVPYGSDAGPYSQAYLRTSTDEARTWGEDRKIPQWLGVNEVDIVRAANGDWVAACRTDYPKRYAHYKLDTFGGLAVSISKDEGRSWSDLKPLYEWGRHHPSMVVLPDDRIVMTYVVRLGYPQTTERDPQFGVEAVVSSDNGLTWNLEHRYVLATWVGNRKDKLDWFCGVQSTSTVLLPDGTLLTAFGTGFTNTAATQVCKMDVAIVTWRLADKP
jgi:hypothetical protein